MVGLCSSHTTQDAYTPGLASCVLLASTSEWWRTERDVTQLTVESDRHMFILSTIKHYKTLWQDRFFHLLRFLHCSDEKKEPETIYKNTTVEKTSSVIRKLNTGAQLNIQHYKLLCSSMVKPFSETIIC